jgi:fumarate reductase flavoprotein subunit
MQNKFFPAVLKTTALLLMAFVFGNCIGFKTVSGLPRYVPGTYEGVGQGFRGQVRLLVRLDTAGITGIEILAHGDDEQLGGAAMEELLALVLDAGGPDVDGISGATESSAGFLAAVEDALSRAGSP